METFVIIIGIIILFLLAGIMVYSEMKEKKDNEEYQTRQKAIEEAERKTRLKDWLES